MEPIKLGPTEYIAIASVIATLVGALATWLVMKRQFQSKRLVYSVGVEPILRRTDPELIFDLKVVFKGEEIPRPTLFNLDIANTGLTAIENAKIIVRLPGTTYLVPGYFLELPPGYGDLWKIEATDAEECAVHLKHINPKQIARVRLLMDETPTAVPQVSCPMPNVQFIRAGDTDMNRLSQMFAHVVLSKFF